ncbi:hypothetical protein EAH87_08595 [Sphingomonas koreensis]|nr:hypothetical protein EAH87_08595 [Sphingomonas koreensis]
MGWAMRRFAPGSFGWLLVHEIRVSIRARARKSMRRWVGYALATVYIVFGCYTGWGLRHTPIAPSPIALIVALTGALLLLSFMTTQAMLGAQRTLYESDDLDLLFSAPLDSRTILLAKLCGIAGTVVLSFAVLLLPIVVPVAVFGHPGLLGVTALLAALALVAACIGLAITLLLARIAGPRAARTAGQIVAGILGGAVFLGSQFLNGDADRQSRAVVIFARIRDTGVARTWIGGLPGKAAFGDPLAILVLLGGAGLLFWVTATLFRRLFRSGVQDAGQHLSRRTASNKAIARHFRASLFGTIFRKEWWLLARDPALAFRIVLRLIYLVPLFALGFRSTNGLPLAPSLAFVSVAIAGQLVGSFAWITVSAEDAPDLIAVAPVEKDEVDWAKLMAAMAMATPLAVLLPIAIATETVVGALATLLFTAIAGGLAGWIELKLGKPVERAKFNRRPPGSFLTRILTLIVTAIIGMVAAVVVYLIGEIGMI